MTALFAFVIGTFVLTAGADDFLEQSWIDRRAQIADREWPIPPPEKWDSPSTIHGNAEAVWDERWTALDRRFGAGIRVALHLVRDGHGRAARAEIPVLVRTLGMINAHSRNPGTDKRSARDHALQIAVSNRILAAAHSLGPLEPQQEEDVLGFMRDFAEAANSADKLEKTTLPVIQSHRRRAMLMNLGGSGAVGTAGYFTFAAFPTFFSVAPAWMSAAPLSAALTALVVYAFGHPVPKRYEADDQNRVGPLVKQKCEDLLESMSKKRHPVESKTNEGRS